MTKKHAVKEKNVGLKLAVERIKAKFKLNQAEIAKKIGVNPTYLSGVINGSYALAPSLEEEIYKQFQVSIEEFKERLTGEGEMLKSEQRTIEAVPYDQNKHPYIFHVPLVSQYAQAGYLSGYADKEYIEALPTVPFFADHNGKGNYMAFEVRGDSMNDGTSDSILEGDILVCRQINRELWMNKLHIRDWEFVIVHREKGVLVKKIANHNVEEGVITIHSLNDFYEDADIYLNDIAMLFNVIQKSRKSR